MPIKIGKRKYKSFKGAQKAVAKKKGISMKRAGAYVATVDRAQHKKKK
jgi:hypothetical protein